MAYRPPILRKAKSAAEVLNETFDEIKNAPVSAFPSLGSSTATSSKQSVSYASKALEWKERKEEIELNERIENELNKQRTERAVRRKEEEDYIKSTLPQRRQAPVAEKVVLVEAPKQESEWTLVQRKPRKEKKFNYDEPEDNISEKEADEPEYGNDKHTLW